MGEVPPFTGVAVNVAGVPGNNGAEASIVTLTGANGITVMLTVFEVAGVPVAQSALEVSIQVIRSLLSMI